MTFLFIYFPKGTVSHTWWHSINACRTELNASQSENRATGAVSPSEHLSPSSVSFFLLDVSVSIIPMKSALSPVLSLETSCSSATCFLIELTSTHLPHQMAPFPCLSLARIYKHISACPDWDMDGHIQGLRLCMSIRRGPNSLSELGRSVSLYHLAFSSCLHYLF